MSDSVWKLRLAAMTLMACLLVSGCVRAPGYERLEGGTMGTYYRVTVFCPGVSAADLKLRLEAELTAVNDQMSTYQADSELMRFNAAPPGDWVEVSGDLLSVLTAAREISARSAGAFDVTVSELVNVWGFGPGGRISSRPSAERIAAAMARVGYEHLELDPSAQRIRRLTPLTVDLSAIAKGHAVDRLAEVMLAHGCEHFLADIGGEVRAHGLNPSGGAWRVGVEVPDPERIGSIQRVLALDSVAVATSGDYRNFLDLNGERYSHTIDPRSGHPVQHDLASVTVVHASTMQADGFATALNVLGLEEGFALAEAEELAALFLVRRTNGFEERYTSAMLNHLAALPES